MENQIFWPWGWCDYDPLDELMIEFDIRGAADKYLKGRKTGSRHNRRIKLQGGDDELHVIFSYRNTSERVADFKKCRVVLKGEEDCGFDIVENWDDVKAKTIHGIAAATPEDFNTACKIADLLDIATASNDKLQACVI